MVRSTQLPLLLCLIAANSIAYVAAAFSWDSFPDCTHPVLQHYAPQSCDHGVVPGSAGLNSTNQCLCSNEPFIQAAAVAIYILCGCDILSQTADQLVNNCNNSATPALVDAEGFVSIGNGNQSICTESFTLPTSGSPVALTCPSCNNNTDLILGLAIGVPGGLIALLALLVTILQLLVAHKKLPPHASPWPIIRESFRDWCCCCTRRRRPQKAALPPDDESDQVEMQTNVP